MAPLSDPRDRRQRLADLTDGRLLAFYNHVGLLRAREGATFDLATVLTLVRGAYWQGVRDLSCDSEGELLRIACDQVDRQPPAANDAAEAA